MLLVDFPNSSKGQPGAGTVTPRIHRQPCNTKSLPELQHSLLSLMENSPDNHLPQGARGNRLWWSLWLGSKWATETTKCRVVWLVGQGGHAAPTSSPRIAVGAGKSKNDPETCSSCGVLPAIAKSRQQDLEDTGPVGTEKLHK